MLGMLSVVVVVGFVVFFAGFWFSFSFSFLGVWGCSLLSPYLTRPEEEEEEGKEKVNVDLLSLASIGGFFLGLPDFGILYKGFPSFYSR